jgi:hypothetical protein
MLASGKLQTGIFMACRLQCLFQIKVLLLSSGWLYFFEATEIFRGVRDIFTYFQLPNSSAVRNLILFQNALFILRFPNFFPAWKLVNQRYETDTSSFGTQDIPACIYFILRTL